MIKQDNSRSPMRLLVSAVASPNIVEGQLVRGGLSRNETVGSLPPGERTPVRTLAGQGQRRDSAQARAELTLELTYSVSIATGNLISAADDRPEFSDQFEARIRCSGQQPLLPGRMYFLEAVGGCSEVTISKLKYRLEDDSTNQYAANTLGPGETAVCNIALTRPTVYYPFSTRGSTGSIRMLHRSGGALDRRVVWIWRGRS